MPIPLFHMLPVILVCALAHLLPWLPRPERLFGVSVDAQVRHGAAARKMLTTYTLRLLPWTLVSLACGLFFPVRWSILCRPCLSLLPLLAAYLLFSSRRNLAAHLAPPPSSLRSAGLTAADAGFFQIAPFVIPLAMLLATGGWLHAHWNRIPAYFPVHWDLHGAANGWSSRTISGVYEPLWIGAGFVLLITTTYMLSSLGSRRSAQSQPTGIICAAVAWVLAAAFSKVALLPFALSSGKLLLFAGASVLPLAVALRASLRHGSGSAPAEREITPNARWHGNVLYYNPDDPALFVEKRIGIGLTLNFANRLSWLVLLVSLLVAAALKLFIHNVPR